MGFRIKFARGALMASAVTLSAALLCGCGGVGVALQSDLDPLRSDISVLEKQFVEVQRAAMEAKRGAQGAQGGTAAPAPQAAPGLDSRLSALEKRMDGVEAGIRELRQAQDAAPTQQMAPEPVVIEPIPEAPRPAAP